MMNITHDEVPITTKRYTIKECDQWEFLANYKERASYGDGSLWSWYEGSAFTPCK